MGLAPWLEERIVTAKLKREQEYTWRTLPKKIYHGIDFSSNDYLDLSKDTDMASMGYQAGRTYGVGSTGSRLLSGNHDTHLHLERSLAEWIGLESALVFNSGYQLNSTLFKALCDSTDEIYIDKLAHNSLIAGALNSEAKVIRFNHNDYKDLRSKLEESADKANRFIVTESVFSMDGDTPDFTMLGEIAKTYNAQMVIDEAHAIGVYGDVGQGLANHAELNSIMIGTFGKAFGLSGAFIAGTRDLTDYLVNFCTGFIYSTAPSPQLTAMIEIALQKIKMMNPLRMRIRKNAEYFRKKLGDIGKTTTSDSHIIPLIIGDASKAMDVQEYLANKQIIAVAIRPPTVPPKTARLRFSLRVSHTNDDIDVLMRWLKSAL